MEHDEATPPYDLYSLKPHHIVLNPREDISGSKESRDEIRLT